VGEATEQWWQEGLKPTEGDEQKQCSAGRSEINGVLLFLVFRVDAAKTNTANFGVGCGLLWHRFLRGWSENTECVRTLNLSEGHSNQVRNMLPRRC
jgi:hypothetical protein